MKASRELAMAQEGDRMGVIAAFVNNSQPPVMVCIEVVE